MYNNINNTLELAGGKCANVGIARYEQPQEVICYYKQWHSMQTMPHASGEWNAMAFLH